MTVDRWKVIAGAGVAVFIIGVLVALLVRSDPETPPTIDAQASDTSPTVASESTTSTTTSTTDPDAGSSERPSGLEASLETLGVDTTATDRVAPDQGTLPGDYSPLGSSPSFGDQAEGSSESGANQTDELLIVGMQLAESGSTISLVEQLGVQIDGDGDIDQGTTSVLQSFNETDNGWAATHGARVMASRRLSPVRPTTTR